MAEANTTLDVAGLPAISLSLDSDAAAVEAVDDGTNGSKRAIVLSGEVNSQAFALLVRVQIAPNGLFLDVVADSSVANLDTRAGAMDLDTVGHPSPAEDAIDTEALAAAAA